MRQAMTEQLCVKTHAVQHRASCLPWVHSEVQATGKTQMGCSTADVVWHKCHNDLSSYRCKVGTCCPCLMRL